MGDPLKFVDYFDRKITATRLSVDEDMNRTGEGACLFANGISIGMETPGDCQGVKMEFDYGVTPVVTGNGKGVVGLDIKMTMDKDWDFDSNQYNATVRGARIQAVSEDDVSGRIEGAYINAIAEGSKAIEGYISGLTGPGIIGVEARTEIQTSATITTPSAVGVLIFSRVKASATLTGKYRGLQIELPMLGAGASISDTTTAIYVGADWGGADAFTTAIDVAVACTTAIDVSAVQADETGLDEACVFKHGTYSNVLAYGTQTTAHLILKSTCISAASTGYYVFGDILRITSSAASTGHLVGSYTFMSLGHTTNNTYATRGRVDVTATAELGLTNALMGEVNVTAGTITQGTGGSINGLHVDMNVTAGATIAQPIHGILVDTSGIAVDIAGEMIGIKVAHAGGSNYLDYGLKFSNCFHNATAVVDFDLSQGNTAIGIRFDAGTAGHVITSALAFKSTTGGTTYFADFSNAAVNLPMSKDSGAKSTTCQGWISVLDTDGVIGYINVWAG